MENLERALSEAGVQNAKLRKVEEIFVFDGPGGNAAIVMWEKLRNRSSDTKYWPVLLGGGDDALDLEEQLEVSDDAPVSEILKSSARNNARNWFEKQMKERLKEFKEYNPDESEDFFTKEGDWPEGVAPSDSFSTPFNILSKQPHAKMAIGLVPTLSSWEVPAFLRLGNWNDCPSADVHCAVLSYWQKQYKAEIVAATRDVIEMRVGSPPTTRDAALALAREQYAYCADIVDQGCETIANLAASLLKGKTWYFWWD